MLSRASNKICSILLATGVLSLAASPLQAGPFDGLGEEFRKTIEEVVDKVHRDVTNRPQRAPVPQPVPQQRREVTQTQVPSEAPPAKPVYERRLVLDVQNRLNQLGYNTGVPDGVYGKNTRRAIQQFQSDQGLLADGVPTNAIVSALNAAFVAAERRLPSVANAPITAPSADLPTDSGMVGPTAGSQTLGVAPPTSLGYSELGESAPEPDYASLLPFVLQHTENSEMISDDRFVMLYGLWRKPVDDSVCEDTWVAAGGSGGRSGSEFARRRLMENGKAMLAKDKATAASAPASRVFFMKLTGYRGEYDFTRQGFPVSLQRRGVSTILTYGANVKGTCLQAGGGSFAYGTGGAIQVEVTGVPDLFFPYPVSEAEAFANRIERRMDVEALVEISGTPGVKGQPKVKGVARKLALIHPTQHRVLATWDYTAKQTDLATLRIQGSASLPGLGYSELAQSAPAPDYASLLPLVLQHAEDSEMIKQDQFVMSYGLWRKPTSEVLCEDEWAARPIYFIRGRSGREFARRRLMENGRARLTEDKAAAVLAPASQVFFMKGIGHIGEYDFERQGFPVIVGLGDGIGASSYQEGMMSGANGKSYGRKVRSKSNPSNIKSYQGDVKGTCLQAESGRYYTDLDGRQRTGGDLFHRTGGTIGVEVTGAPELLLPYPVSDAEVFAKRTKRRVRVEALVEISGPLSKAPLFEEDNSAARSTKKGDQLKLKGVVHKLVLVDPDQKKVLVTWDNKEFKEASAVAKKSASPLTKIDAITTRTAKQVDLATLSIQGVNLGVSPETAKSTLKQRGYTAYEISNQYRKSCVASKTNDSGRHMLGVDWPVSVAGDASNAYSIKYTRSFDKSVTFDEAALRQQVQRKFGPPDQEDGGTMIYWGWPQTSDAEAAAVAQSCDRNMQVALKETIDLRQGGRVGKSHRWTADSIHSDCADASVADKNKLLEFLNVPYLEVQMQEIKRQVILTLSRWHVPEQHRLAAIVAEEQGQQETPKAELDL